MTTSRALMVGGLNHGFFFEVEDEDDEAPDFTFIKVGSTSAASELYRRLRGDPLTYEFVDRVRQATVSGEQASR